MLYLGNFNQYGAVFGRFFLLMIWAYLVAQALTVGAELNGLFRPAASEKAKGARAGRRAPSAI